MKSRREKIHELAVELRINNTAPYALGIDYLGQLMWKTFSETYASAPCSYYRGMCLFEGELADALMGVATYEQYRALIDNINNVVSQWKKDIIY